MIDQWLICKFLKGMFSDELAIVYRSASFFIPKTFVVPVNEEDAKVRVRVFKNQDKTFAILPTEDNATIAVEQKDLIAA